MRKMTLYRSVLVGMTTMLAAIFFSTVVNLLCILDVLTLPVSFVIHAALFLVGCAVPLVCFLLRLRSGNLFWEPEALLAGVTSLLVLGMLLIMMLAVWVASFTAALLL